MPDPSLLGIPKPFHFEGVEWLIQDPRDFRVEAEFVAWVEAQAYLLVQRHRAIMSPLDYDEHMKRWQRDGATKVYSWSGEYCWQARWSMEGAKELCYLQMKRAEAMATEGGRQVEHYADRTLVERIFADPVKAREMTALIREEHRRKNEPAEQER